MKNKFLNDKDYNLWWFLHQTVDLMSKARNRELSQYGITTEQAAVLFVIKALGATNRKITPGVIAKWLPREPHSVSRILMRMEKAGLVNRTAALNSKREVNISLTEKGEQVYQQSEKRETIRGIISSLSKEGSQQLRSLLEILRKKTLEQLSTNNEDIFPLE